MCIRDRHYTWTHGLLWSISMPAKVPGGCRLQFEQIARDVRCRKPSSKDDIMRSTWFCCYSNCDNCFNAFREENCCYRSKASPLSFLFVTCRPYPLLKPFWIWSGNRAADFQVKTGGDVGKFCRLMRYNYLFIKHGLVHVSRFRHVGAVRKSLKCIPFSW